MRSEAEIQTNTALAIAEQIRCDIYQQLAPKRKDKTLKTVDYQGHDICYWGSAAAGIALSFATWCEFCETEHDVEQDCTP